MNRHRCRPGTEGTVACNRQALRDPEATECDFDAILPRGSRFRFSAARPSVRPPRDHGLDKWDSPSEGLVSHRFDLLVGKVRAGAKITLTHQRGQFTLTLTLHCCNKTLLTHRHRPPGLIAKAAAPASRSVRAVKVLKKSGRRGANRSTPTAIPRRVRLLKSRQIDSFNSLEARKATFLLALICIASPVAGLRPMRAARRRT
jgi:hypothetical protein